MGDKQACMHARTHAPPSLPPHTHGASSHRFCLSKPLTKLLLAQAILENILLKAPSPFIIKDLNLDLEPSRIFHLLITQPWTPSL